MCKSTENIIRIIKAGGQVSFDGSKISVDNLLRIINAAVSNKRTLTVRNLESKSTDNIIRLVKSGGDFLIVEL